MGFFKPKSPVDVDEFDWLVAAFAWLHRHLGTGADGELIVPTLALPETPSLVAASSGSELFAAVKDLAGMGEWECLLEQGDPLQQNGHLADMGEQEGSHALGLFIVEGDTPIIRYAPELLKNPGALVATFAHELAHLLSASLGDPPGGHDLHEHATDCAAVYLGFGVFLANTARQFESWEDGTWAGWRSSTSGYLSENALVTAMAIFVRMFEVDPDPVKRNLKAYLNSDFQKALKYIDWRHPDIGAAIESVDLREWA